MSTKATLFFVLILLGFVGIIPFAAIWSFNILFSLGVEYGFYEWLAAAILIQMFGGARYIAQNVNNGFKPDKGLTTLMD